MGIDFTGGWPDDREFVLPEQPDNPEMHESVNAWIWDAGDEIGMPRIGIEAVGEQWETHDIQANIALKGGRVLNIFEPGKVHPPLGTDGRARILGAGPLRFELLEPYRHWQMRLEGTAVQISSQAQIDGWIRGVTGGDPVDVEIEVDLQSAAPPWECGSLHEDVRRILETQDEGALMGGPRFEQLCRATGSARIGKDHYQLNGGALRIRRTGVRRLATFRGHVWQSALFPSGRGFGAMLYPPRPDGKPTFNEGFLFGGDGSLIPARVVAAPWLHQMQPSGADVSLELESEGGRTAIRGETVLSTFSTLGANGRHLEQGIVRYTWDGETTNGMLERSTPDA
jgi:hypothetical protein